METSQQGVDLIKHFEGCVLEAYPDPGNPETGEPWTIGYGHTAGVKKGMKISAEKAEKFLKEDLKEFEGYVSAGVKVPLVQHQFDALVSFCYNVGPGNFTQSTLLRLLNEKRYDMAAQQFPRWNRGASGVMPGLVNRREAEKRLFLGAGFP